MSTYTAGTSFSTLACSVPCLQPTGLITSNITLTGATLSWTANSGALTYVVHYRPVTTPVSTWISISTQNTTVPLSGLTCGTQYEWQVANYCSTTPGGFSSYSPSVTFTTLSCTIPCLPPAGLTTTNITLTGASLSWIAPGSALGYVVQYRPVTTPASTWINVTSQLTSLTLTSLTCGTQYEWQVATYCGNGVMSTYAAGTSFSTIACSVPCLPSTGLITSNITLTGATLSWAANSGALTYVVHYRPVTTPVSTWISISTQNTSVTLSGLTCGTQYEWQVANYCSTAVGGFSPYSPSVTFTTLACTIPCLPPAGLTTTNITLTGATFSWIAPGSALGYMVQYRPMTIPASAWINVTASITSVTISSLSCGTQYEWQVASYCSNAGSILSAYSTPINFTTLACSIPCVVPTGLITSNITQTGVTLSWTAATGVYTYLIQYRPVTTPASTWTSTSLQTTSLTLTSLTCGIQYEWQVATYCGNGVMSTYTAGTSFSTLACSVPCLPPTGLITSNIILTGATLSWTANSGALTYVVHYRPVTTPVSAWISVNATTTSVTISNLICGTQYEWQVGAICSNTPGSIISYSTPISFSTLACVVACLPPTGLTTSTITLTGATLSWIAPGSALGYVVQYRPGTTPASTWINVTSQLTSVTLTSLTCGTQYEWQVATYCGNGVMSTYTAGTSFSTLACAVPCLPPIGLTTTNITLTGATLSWTANSGALTYVVHYRPVTTPVSTWSSISTQNTTIPLSGLNCGTQYEWQVANYCSTAVGGFSSYSPSVTFTTLACVVTCLPPAGLTTTNITLTGATLSWIAPGSALGYVVQYRPVTTPASAWINVTATTTSVTLSSLSCGTQYEWEVAIYCSNVTNVLSAYSTPISFTTLACAVPCNPPTGLTTTNITLTGATLSWTANSGAITYVVHYRPVTTPVSTWSSVSTQNTTVPLSGLTCGTQYEWQVANYCSTTPGGFSSYSPLVTFTTLACTVPCLPPAGLTTTNITLTGATLSWIVPSGVLAYVVHYRPVTTPTSAWITVAATTNTVILSNLNCGTTYEWQVASYCSNVGSALSVYSTPISFSTLTCTLNNCAVPSGLTSIFPNTIPSNLMLQWNSTNANSYNIRYKKVSTSAYIMTTSATNSKLLTGLTNGQYEWQVQSICASNTGLALVSPWSVTAWFSISGNPVIFPNPVLNKEIHLSLVIEAETTMIILITDQFGNTVKLLNKTVTPNTETLDIDVSDLKNGIYFIQINGDNINEFQKIVVMR
jgi:energy-converting hydrogenase Eha subunit G